MQTPAFLSSRAFVPQITVGLLRLRRFHSLSRLTACPWLAAWLFPTAINTYISTLKDQVPPAAIAGLVLLSLAIIGVPLLALCLYRTYKQESRRVQDTVVETYKYQGKYGFDPYKMADGAAPLEKL